MNDTKDPATPTGNIPVLFDIVERGKFAPAENMIKPPPEGGGDNIDTDSESTTIVPGPQPHPNTEVTKSPLDELGDVTEENPIITAEMLETESTEFTGDVTEENPIITARMLETESTEFKLDSIEAITDENPIIPKAMLELSESQNELVDQVMQKLMPRLEELALETVHEIVKSSQNTETPDQEK